MIALNDLPEIDGFDPAHATEAEIDAAYKARYRLVAEQLGCEDLHGIPREWRDALSEQGRQDWISWYGGTNAQEQLAKQAARTAAARSKMEQEFGVSDKAPPKPAAQPHQIVGAQAMAAHDDYADDDRDSPTDEHREYDIKRHDGTPEDVDAAMRAVFGSSMEDT